MPDGILRVGGGVILDYNGVRYLVSRGMFANPGDFDRAADGALVRFFFKPVGFGPTAGPAIPDAIEYRALPLPPVPVPVPTVLMVPVVDDDAPVPMVVARLSSPMAATDVDLGTGAASCSPGTMEKEKEAAKPDDKCCKLITGLMAQLTGAETLPLGPMIRAIYDCCGFISRSKTLAAISFDISFLWSIESLNICSSEEKKTGIEELMSFGVAYKMGPSTKRVASCHPTAESMVKCIGFNPRDQVGQLGPVQSQGVAMAPHQAACVQLCDSLTAAVRGIWWVTMCGHSFVLVKRASVGQVEIIDSFAEDRGLGLWCLTAGEIASKPPKFFDYVHLPPAVRLFSTGDLVAQLRLLTDDSQERRYAAQLVLSNYQYEMPDGTVDRLPYGPFGFRQYDLAPDSSILYALAQRFGHSHTYWKKNLPKG